MEGGRERGSKGERGEGEREREGGREGEGGREREGGREGGRAGEREEGMRMYTANLGDFHLPICFRSGRH